MRVLGEEDLLVADDVRGPRAGQYPDLVQRVLAFFVGQVVQLDLLERILLAVRHSLHTVHLAVGPLA